METQKKNNNSKILYISLSAAALLVIVLSVLYYMQNRELTEIVDGLTEEKNILTQEYQNLMFNFDSLQSDNDTLNYMLEMERQRIANLVEELKTIRATNTAKIREYQRELTTLRGVLRSYIIQIDSLNTINQELTRENIEHRRRYSQIQTSVRQLEATRATLEQKVTIASRLDVINMMAEGLNPSGRSTNRSSRTNRIKVCFTILRNVTAPVGMKEIYLRIERPDGQLLMHSRDDVFTHENTQINFSAKRAVEYGGEELDVCIFYNADVGELISGEYTADIFADGFHIGSHTFSLR
ncbi:hypothetical protein [Alkalitalea saponilacus]|uniref:Cell division protein ZapB n=1 Tax=Alkalitalea saponilacus TaxID=889453 RepID=A0A1T5FMF9_9BACT|nr:hypothetical protein [Alkalitalea saponilacus]ASB49443.1 hypothetical protein CDL62_09990 [Alkalitalea saponilacus]SKB97381.1 hypothetical protein SAMN03080601_01631 [Alkalitalea saponilacus]